MLATLVITGEYEIRGSEGRLKGGAAAHLAETHAEGDVHAISSHFTSGSVGEDLERSSSWKRGSGQGELLGGVLAEWTRGQGMGSVLWIDKLVALSNIVCSPSPLRSLHQPDLEEKRSGAAFAEAFNEGEEVRTGEK